MQNRQLSPIPLWPDPIELYLAQIHVNHRCNIIPEARCTQYCYQYLFQNMDMSFNTFQAILQHYKPRQIALGGGEPTLHPQFLDFLKFAKSQPFVKHVNYTTNGVSLPKYFEQVEDLVSGISISLDTLRYPKLFTEGIPDPIKRNLQEYKESKMQIVVNFVLSEENFYDLSQLPSFLLENGLQIVYLLSLKEKDHPFNPPRQEFKSAINHFLIDAFKLGIIVARDCCLASFESKSNKCKSVKDFLAFDTDGSPLPCSFSQLLGDLPCHFISSYL
ncbi:MAG: radical SAM protein [Promethearchaeota archaeon]